MSNKSKRNKKTTRKAVAKQSLTDGRKKKRSNALRVRLSTEKFSDQPMNEKARSCYLSALNWADGNGDLWASWIDDVRARVSTRKLWSVKELAEEVRRSGRVNDVGGEFVINNNTLPALARMLCEAVRGAENLTELRVSVFERAAEERKNG